MQVIERDDAAEDEARRCAGEGNADRDRVDQQARAVAPDEVADLLLADLNRRLADRKLLERAKGLLQTRFRWTEEQAYLHLRNISRRRRTPMREIAQEVIGRLPAMERPV